MRWSVSNATVDLCRSKEEINYGHKSSNESGEQMNANVVINKSGTVIINPNITTYGVGIILDARESKLDDVTIVNPRIRGANVGIISVGDKGISGLKIEGGRISDCDAGVQLSGVWDGIIGNTRVWDCRGTAVDCTGSWGLHLDRVEGTTSRVGIKPAKWSQNLVTAQLNREVDIEMDGLEQCHILPGIYLEDSGVSTEGYGLHMMGCNECIVDVPAIQRGHKITDCDNCDVTIRGQRGRLTEKNNWRWRNKPSVEATRCTGRFAWPADGTVVVKDCKFDDGRFWLPPYDQEDFLETAFVSGTLCIKTIGAGKIALPGFDLYGLETGKPVWAAVTINHAEPAVPVISGDIKVLAWDFVNFRTTLRNFCLE